MSTIPTHTIERKNPGGRRTRYGVRAERLLLYVPPELRRRLQHEANIRNLRDEINDWNAGNVAVDMLLDLHDMDRVRHNIGRSRTTDKESRNGASS